MSAVRLIGVDPSLAATGIAVLHMDGRNATPWMSTTTVATPSNLDTERRMQIILGQLWRVALQVDGVYTIVGIEQPLVPRDKTTQDTVLKLGGLHWLIRYGLYVRNIPAVVVGNTRLKLYATGMGNAGKAITTEAANYHMRNLAHAGDDNQADAMWLAAMLSHRYIGRPLFKGTVSHDPGRVLSEMKKWPQWTPWP